MRKKSRLFLIPLLGLTLLLSSCMTADFSAVETSVYREDYAGARQSIERRKDELYTDNDKVLYNLDAGLLSHYAGDWDQSNKNFSVAESLIEEYYSKSISQGVSSYFVNDMVVDYAGEDYEDIYTNFFMALNYIQLGNIEDAMVEIRRFDNKQKLLTTKYDSQIEYAESELGSGYSNVSLQFQNSAAARYLSMLMYRSRGQDDSAEVDRKLLVRAFNEQKSLYNFGIPSCVSDELAVPRGKARLNVIGFTGLAPTKVESVSRIDVGDVYCKIAVPIMVDRGSLVTSISVDVYDASGNVQTFVEQVPEDRYVEVYVEKEDEESKEEKNRSDDYAESDDESEEEMYEGDENSRYAYDRISAIVAKSTSERAKEIVEDEMEASVLSQASKNVDSGRADDVSADSRSAAARARALAMGVEPAPEQSAQPAKTTSSSSSSQTDAASRSSAARERAAAMGIEQAPARSTQSSKQTVPASTGTAKNVKSVPENHVPVTDQALVCNSSLEKIESIENIAMDTFAQHSSVIYSRAMIRAIGKTMKTGALSLASELTDDSTLSAVFSVLSFVSQVSDEVTEQADLRTSRFFPANIYVGGITLDPGVYTVVVTFRGYNGLELSSKTYYDVNVTTKSVNILEAICLK